MRRCSPADEVSRAVDLTALAELAARVGEALISEDLELIELNPVFARHDGATAVDAVARRSKRVAPSASSDYHFTMTCLGSA